MSNSKKIIIGVAIGCCSVIVILLLVGGYYSYKAINNQVQIEQEKTQTKQDIVEYNNQTVDLRNDIVFVLEHLTNTITADESADKIDSARVEFDKKVEILKDFAKTSSKSNDLNSLIKEYLEICDKLTAKAKEMVTNYADTPKFNTAVEEYNLLIDDLNAKNDEINDFADSLNTSETSTDEPLYDASFDYSLGN